VLIKILEKFAALFVAGHVGLLILFS